MKLLITGAAGFTGSTLISHFLEVTTGLSIIGMDNLLRAGSELNLNLLHRLGVTFVHGDVRNASDFETLPDVDWIIDARRQSECASGSQRAEHKSSGPRA